MRKILFIVVLIFCLLTTTQTAYAYFDKDTIQVLNEDGELYKLTEISSNDYQELIPQGSILGVNDTYTLTYKYEVYIEDGIHLDSQIDNIKWGEYLLNDSDLKEIYNFAIRIESLKDVELSQGLFTESTTGELLEITITVTMNDCENLNNIVTYYECDLSFDYLLTVSK